VGNPPNQGEKDIWERGTNKNPLPKLSTLIALTVMTVAMALVAIMAIVVNSDKNRDVWPDPHGSQETQE